MENARIPALIAELEDELDLLRRLVGEIGRVEREIPEESAKRTVYEESLALRLHIFYTGCERIFGRIAEEIDGSRLAPLLGKVEAVFRDLEEEVASFVAFLREMVSPPGACGTRPPGPSQRHRRRPAMAGSMGTGGMGTGGTGT